MKAILHLTKNCNLRCKYCYAPSKVDESMTIDTARKAIDLVCKLGQTSACVSYFGGEPLLKYEMIKELTEYAALAGERAGKSMHYRLSTNGLLFTEEILQFLKEHNVLFAVSLDGNKAAHDAQRILPNGEGSFDLLNSKLDMILAYNPLAVFTSVITPMSAPHLLESAEFMWSRGIRYTVYQPDYTYHDWDLDTFATLKKSYQQLAEWYLDKTRSGEYFYMSLFDGCLKTHARSPVKLGSTCDFGARKISIAPNGQIYPCVQFVSDRDDAKRFLIGNVDDGLNDNWQRLIKANKQARPQCEGCALLGRCSNYCGCLNWQTTGEITQVSPLVCEHERMLIPIADEIGNTLWKEKNPAFLKKHYKFLNEAFELYGID